MAFAAARAQYERRWGPADPDASSSTSGAGPAATAVVGEAYTTERVLPEAAREVTEAAAVTRTGSPRTAMLEGGVNRTVFWSAFIDLHVPKKCNLQCDRFSFFKLCMELPTAQPSLLHGLDTLSLIQIGSITNDKRLLKEATQTYAKALKALRHALSVQELLHDDHILAAVMVLKVCEFYTELASPKGVGWGEHVRGAQHLLALRGPASVQTDVALELFANARHGALCHGLLTRRASAFAQPSWSAVSRRGKVTDQSSSLHDIAIRIPGLLEQYDGLDPQRHGHVDEIDAFLAEARSIEQGMRTWLSNWAAGQYETRSVDEFANFSSLCSDRTFGTAHMFKDFMVAYLHSTYWICMSFLRTTVRGLHAARAVSVRGYMPSPGQAVREEEILEYIVNMCQCIPYFCEPASSTMGCISIFLPLRTAALYFTGQGMLARARWVGNVRRSCLNKGLAPPSIDKMKLRDCGDLALYRADAKACFA
ncbi:hypothetical protein LTR53_000285 [Teratosphaeriaceae sp. CCFEE 6253]|nr:hypothetical protein LTR53_000285 [Teratosphaeriaceae sp. CCFEE 6253]